MIYLFLIIGTLAAFLIGKGSPEYVNYSGAAFASVCYVLAVVLKLNGA